MVRAKRVNLSYNPVQFSELYKILYYMYSSTHPTHNVSSLLILAITVLLTYTVLDFWANQTPLFGGKLLRHPNSPDLSDSLDTFSQFGKM